MLGQWRAAGTVLLVVAGTIFRLWTLPWARFTGDESSFWATAQAVAALEQFPVLGPEITGTPAHLPGPAFHYLTALPQLVSASPFAGGAFIALLHVVAGGLLIDLARRARGPRAGLVALALWAFAPWDVLYGDRIWASCLAPVLGTAAIYAAARASDEPRWLSLSIFLCLLLPQVHLSAPIVWATVAMVLLLRSPRSSGGWRWGAAGAGGALFTYIPFVEIELRSGLSNTRAILAHSGGEEGLGAVLAVPLKVFGYAVLYASAEIGYQFERGYWGGGFDEWSAYATVEGWTAWSELHGPFLGALILVSVGLAALGWGLHYGAILRRGRSDEGRFDLDAAVGLGLLFGLLAGTALMMASRKIFFPHYANILMPLALWPAAMGIDRGLGHARLRISLTVALVGAAAAMAITSVRYYRTIDGMNGLGPTLAMVETVLKEPMPVAVRFTHFRNEFAWRKLADQYFGRKLLLNDRAPVSFQVFNSAPAEARGDGPLFGPVRMTRTERADRRAPPEAAWIAHRDWLDIEVRVRGAMGMDLCVPEPPARPRRCRYGPHPWQRFEPENLSFSGRLETVLFLHPVSNATVSASAPVPEGVRGGELRFGLSDAAHRSNNKSPVRVVLRQGVTELVRTQTNRQTGLQTYPFAVEASGAPVTVEIWTANDGARVFGFDLWLLTEK